MHHASLSIKFTSKNKILRPVSRLPSSFVPCDLHLFNHNIELEITTLHEYPICIYSDVSLGDKWQVLNKSSITNLLHIYPILRLLKCPKQVKKKILKSIKAPSKYINFPCLSPWGNLALCPRTKETKGQGWAG